MARKASSRKRRSHHRKRSIKRKDGVGTPLRKSPLRKSPKSKRQINNENLTPVRRFGTNLMTQTRRSPPRLIINDENENPLNRPVKRRSPTGRRFGTNLTNLRF